MTTPDEETVVDSPQEVTKPEVDPTSVVIDLDVHDSILGHTSEVTQDG